MKLREHPLLKKALATEMEALFRIDCSHCRGRSACSMTFVHPDCPDAVLS
jgi:hypothetical protein